MSTERINLEVPATANAFSVVRRVLGGLGSRLGYSLDDLEDLYLATEGLLHAALGREALEWVRIAMVVDSGDLSLAIGPFTSPHLREEVAAKVQACDAIDLCRLLHRTMDEVLVTDAGEAFDVVLVRRRREALP